MDNVREFICYWVAWWWVWSNEMYRRSYWMHVTAMDWFWLHVLDPKEKKND